MIYTIIFLNLHVDMHPYVNFVTICKQNCNQAGPSLMRSSRLGGPRAQTRPKAQGIVAQRDFYGSTDSDRSSHGRTEDSDWPVAMILQAVLFPCVF